MAKVYITRCIVKRDGKQYAKGAVIEGLSETEIKQGLAQHWLEAVGLGEEPITVKDSNNKNSSKRNRLLARAKEHGIDVDDTMTEKEIQQLVTEKLEEAKQEAREELLARAKELGITVTEAMTDGEIQQLIEKAQ